MEDTFLAVTGRRDTSTGRLLTSGELIRDISAILRDVQEVQAIPASCFFLNYLLYWASKVVVGSPGILGTSRSSGGEHW
jgi:hypothetical protein